MSLVELGAIGELLGGIAVLVTLVYLAVQLKKNGEIANADAYASSQTVSLQSEMMLINLAPLLIKLKNNESLTEAELFQIDRAIEARHNMAFLSYARNKALKQGSHELAVDQFAVFLLDNPHIHERWERYRWKMIERRRVLGIGTRVTSLGAEWAGILDNYLEILTANRNSADLENNKPVE